MFPFRNILFPTDFTANAHAALKYAAAFARHSGGRVFLFSAQDAKAAGTVEAQGQELLRDPLLSGVDKELVLVAPGRTVPRLSLSFQRAAGRR